MVGGLAGTGARRVRPKRAEDLSNLFYKRKAWVLQITLAGGAPSLRVENAHRC